MFIQITKARFFLILSFLMFSVSANSVYALDLIDFHQFGGVAGGTSSVQGDGNNTHYFIQGESWTGGVNNRVSILDKNFNGLGLTAELDNSFDGFSAITNISVFGGTQFHLINGGTKIQAYDFNGNTLGTTTASFGLSAGLDNASAFLNPSFDNNRWFILNNLGTFVRLVDGTGTVFDTLNVNVVGVSQTGNHLA